MTDQLTVDTYNKSADLFAEYFRGIGSRKKDIQEALTLAGNIAHPRILEIGCGDGRDARYITKYADWYTGFDISEEFIKLARKHVPKASFVVADATSFDYPKDLDIVFAFASLLHLNREEIQKVLNLVYQALKPNGLFYISLKHASKYEKKTKKDDFGTRVFYYYNPEVITKLAGEHYEVVQKNIDRHRNKDWFTVVLKKG